MERITLLKGDITKVETDVIVNAANTSLLGGGGVDGAIHRAGGSEILNDCRKIVAKQGGCKIGEAVITSAGKLPAKFVIHTVGPVWNGGSKNEVEKLSNCYRNSLKLALENNCKTIAFPNISTGIYKFPKELAAKTSFSAIKHFLEDNSEIQMVFLVCFDDESYSVYENEIKQFSKIFSTNKK